MGFATADAEISALPSGTEVANFSIGTNHSIKKNDEWTDIPTFTNVTAWDKLAETAKGITKGVPVGVIGRLSVQSWEDKSGKKQYKTVVVAESIFIIKKENHEVA